MRERGVGGMGFELVSWNLFQMSEIFDPES